MRILSLSANRTNLELKLAIAASDTKRQSCQSHQSGIETFKSTCRESVPTLPIAPIWNWNFVFLKSFNCLLVTANRTNLELKRFRSIPGLWSPMLPIAPIWNWNLLMPTGQPLPLCYQSYQSGIETNINGHVSVIFWIYQSYQSGIETGLSRICYYTGADYQSYQSGIETL